MKAYRKKKKYLQTESIVLKVYDFGEADRIFTLLSPLNGIIRVVAKGIRKPKSRMGGHIDVMSKVNAYISLGENLSNLSQVEMIDNYSLLKKDLSVISIGFYLLELCEKFSVENDPNNDIYQHLSLTLDLLLSSSNKNILIRWFEINLLIISGFLPELYTCLISGEKLSEGDHLFSSINGGLVDKKFATSTDNYILMDKNSIKSLRFLSNNSWSDVEKIKIPNNSLEKLRIVMRKYIQAITNSQINSEKFLSKVS
ncbi:MAG: DNA repair protein RecO [Dehalococcoidia bacterium]|nr:DNA repair protein RecO [Dehalococcoidia bacterium]